MRPEAKIIFLIALMKFYLNYIFSRQFNFWKKVEFLFNYFLWTAINLERVKFLIGWFAQLWIKNFKRGNSSGAKTPQSCVSVNGFKAVESLSYWVLKIRNEFFDPQMVFSHMRSATKIFLGSGKNTFLILRLQLNSMY